MSFGSVVAGLLIGTCPLCGGNYLQGLCSACREQGPIRRTTKLGTPCFALGNFEGELERGIKLLKFSDEPIWARHLGAALSQVVPALPHRVTLVPVPLHPLRCAERGYNQAALLARSIGAQRRWEVRLDLLKRRVPTAQQARLSLIERKQNVKDAFFSPVPANPSNSKESPIVLVDDVITSGNTLDACSIALQNAGWVVVGGLCCASAGAPRLREAF